MKNKIIVCSANRAEVRIQPYLDEGWSVKLCVAENVSSTDSSQPGTYAAKGHVETCGSIVFILEKAYDEYPL